jgi:uncharacterized protein
MIVKRILFLLLASMLFLVNSKPAVGQEIPKRPFPPRLVNDFASMLKPEEISYLESKLLDFNDSTSTQIAIVTVNSLDGYPIADYAQRLGEAWGVGQAELDNGIVIVVKPGKDGARGEVFIAPGYGLEGSIPDLLCLDIVTNEVLPSFRNGRYLEGLDKATSTLMSLARGEFTADEYTSGRGSRKSDSGGLPLIAIIIIVLIIIGMMKGRSGGSNNRHFSSGNLPLWLLLGMMNSGRGSHGGSWGGFSGGGGGGFGGFGGGSFGGGGAGGSW